MEATHEISASYYPNRDELELTFRHIVADEKIEIVVACMRKEVGEKFAEIVPTCIYHPCTIKSVDGKETE